MTPDQETELFAKLRRLIKMAEAVRSKQDVLLKQVGTLQAWIG